MNYSQKRTLIGRIVYISLTLIAVTVLCVTMYTFFSSGKSKELPPTETKAEESKKSAETTSKETEKAKDTQVSAETDEPDEPVNADTDAEPTVVTPETDWSKIKVIMPVDGIVYKKHDLNTAVFSVTMNDYRVHQGIDIECSDSTDVVSCAYGKIKAIGYDSFMGNTVVIDHGSGLVSYYRNLSSEFPDGIKTGATVYAGQYIGTVSDSAIIEISDEPHLHFELELNGKQIDPMTMLDYDEKTAVEMTEQDDK